MSLGEKLGILQSSLSAGFSPVHQLLPNPVLRRALTGIGMGLTAICIVYSPWGKQSGAHFNPSFTLTFFRLGKIHTADAVFYILFQFVGGVGGVLLSLWVLGDPVRHPSVNYVATNPGPYGLAAAFGGELLISFLQMTIVLKVSNHATLARFTGLIAGAMVAIYISIESPLSGMSMNPARTFASAFPGQLWNGWWIYFTAPLIGMLSAAQVHLWKQGKTGINCAKLHHHNNKRCTFCEYQHGKAPTTGPAVARTAIAS
jgi:aquaporin Z